MEKITELLSNTSTVTLGAITLSLASIGFILIKTRSQVPEGFLYPPGPPQDLIIGSFRSFPKDNLYETFNEWQKLYGDIVYLQVPGMTMMVINSMDMAQELLSKRASNNSGRMIPYMAKELLGWNWSLAFRQGDATHQHMRKMIRRGFGPQRVSSHNALIEKSSSQMLLELQGLHGNPTDIVLHAVGRIVIQVTYGEQIWETHGRELIAQNNEAAKILFTTFGKIWLVDILPILRYIPSWMPGAEFRRRGLRSSYLTNRIRRLPFQRSQKLYASKELGHSLVSDLFDEFGQTDEVMDTLGSLYFAGSDSTSNSIVHFLHCMFIFPEIAAKVHKEIEDVIGNDRLPTLADRKHLPYTEATWLEGLRWNTSLPIAIPHVNIQDETVNGYFIPKGSLINPNIGFMLNDPKIWGDPEVFRPERHLTRHNPAATSLPNPSSLIFGFGTRICPGREIASAVSFHFCATIMATYNLLPFDGKKRPDPNTVEYTRDTLRWPTDFDCQFVPRGDKAVGILAALEMSGNT